MLRLAAITNDPLATKAIWGFGLVVLIGLAVFAAGVWVVVLLGRARRAAQDFDASASDPGLETLRNTRLVVRARHAQRGQPETVVAQLEEVETSEPAPKGGSS